MTSNFTFEVSVLTFQTIDSGEDAKWPMKARSIAASDKVDRASTSWECYSEHCPDFIIVNPIDLTVSVDGTKTWGVDAAGLYVLNIVTEELGTNKGELILLEEFMIAIKYSKNEADI